METDASKIQGSSLVVRPSLDHFLGLERCLKQLVDQEGISTLELHHRQTLIQEFNNEFSAAEIGCSLVLYGSSVTGLGVTDADLNVTLAINNQDGNPLNTKAPATSEVYWIQEKVMGFFKYHPKVKRCFLCPRKERVFIMLKNGPRSPEDKHDAGRRQNLLTLSLKKEDDRGLNMTNLVKAYLAYCPSILRTLVIAWKCWAKICKINDEDKEGLPSWCWSVWVISFLQYSNYLPVLNPTTLEPVEQFPNFKKDVDTPGLLGSLWMQMFRHYSSDDRLFTHTLSIRKLPFPHQRPTKHRRAVVEDPFGTERDNVKTSPQLFKYLLQALHTGFLYFGFARVPKPPIEQLPVEKLNSSNLDDSVYSCSFRPTSPSESTHSLPEDDQDEITFLRNNFQSLPPVEKSSECVDFDDLDNSGVLTNGIESPNQSNSPGMYEYVFDGEVLLPRNQSHPLKCRSCSFTSHYVSECPLETLESADPWEYGDETAAKTNWTIIGQVLQENFDKEALTSEDTLQRQKAFHQLKAFLEKIPGTTLRVMGSSVNGFGLRGSDLDMCLNFDNTTDDSGKIKSVKSVMRQINHRINRRRDSFQTLRFIRNSRVPVIKATHLETNVQCDITAGSTVSVRSTMLLHIYSTLDPRVRILGIMWKKLFKLVGLSSAAQAGLASYGFSLMLIYFLQNTRPPVLPVLQEIGHDRLKPCSVNGWDVQYFRDLQNLQTAWRQNDQNLLPPARLWLNLLKFYGFEFNFGKQVICIRQLLPVWKLSKFWPSTSLIAIEDPFILSHNVGGCLSRRASVKIVNTIRKFFAVFTSPLDDYILDIHGSYLHYFTSKEIMGHEDHKNIFCRACERAGQHSAQCPLGGKRICPDPNAFLD